MVTQVTPVERVTTGYSWTECPRWYEDSLYFSDLFNKRVMTVDSGGSATTYADLSQVTPVEGEEVVVVGTGFLPDGRLLINSMFEKRTYVFDGGRTEVYADLAHVATSPINDMVVDAAGRAYVSQLGWNLFIGEEQRESFLLVIEPDGKPRAAEEAGPVMGANGLGLSSDGRTLFVAEAFADRVLAFDIAADGTLSGRRIFAETDSLPDGLCVDDANAVWVGMPGGGGAKRILEGGTVDAVVAPPAEEAGASVACVLGGPDRKTLFVCCGFEIMDRQKSVSEGKGSIWRAQVPVGGGTTRP